MWYINKDLHLETGGGVEGVLGGGGDTESNNSDKWWEILMQQFCAWM